jgi:hypothetical protein
VNVKEVSLMKLLLTTRHGFESSIIRNWTQMTPCALYRVWA